MKNILDRGERIMITTIYLTFLTKKLDFSLSSGDWMFKTSKN